MDDGFKTKKTLFLPFLKSEVSVQIKQECNWTGLQLEY